MLGWWVGGWVKRQHRACLNAGSCVDSWPPNPCCLTLSLQVGVAFTRFQSRFFQAKYGNLDSAGGWVVGSWARGGR